MALKLAFQAAEELTTDHLVAAIPQIRALSKTDAESVTEMTHWLDSHTMPAGNGHVSPIVSGGARKRRVTV